MSVSGKLNLKLLRSQSSLNRHWFKELLWPVAPVDLSSVTLYCFLRSQLAPAVLNSIHLPDCPCFPVSHMTKFCSSCRYPLLGSCPWVSPGGWSAPPGAWVLLEYQVLTCVRACPLCLEIEFLPGPYVKTQMISLSPSCNICSYY